jgi:hypothetical protein
VLIPLGMTGNFAPAAPKCLARQPKQFAPDLRRYADLVDGLEGRLPVAYLTPAIEDRAVEVQLLLAAR